MSRIFWKRLELLGATMLMTRSKCKYGESKSNHLNSTYNKCTANSITNLTVMFHTCARFYKPTYLLNQTEKLLYARDCFNELLIFK